MADGDGVPDRGEKKKRAIRVGLDETAGSGDVAALRTWLEREQPLQVLVNDHELQIHEQVSTDRTTDETGAPMGAGTEIVIQLIGAAGGVAFAQLLNQVVRSVEAWRENRRRVEGGEPPRGTIDPMDGDG